MRVAYTERFYFGIVSLTAALTLLLIVVGAAVRVTHAETGCGGTWPLCDGRVLPPLANSLAWLDWTHRLITLLTVLCMVGAGFAARRLMHQRPEVTTPLYLGLGLLALQSLMGAGNVLVHAETTLPLLHLGFAVIILSCLVASLTSLVVESPLVVNRDKFPLAVQGATLMIFMVLMTGALVVGSHSSTACGTWPLCDNTASEAALLHWVHRGSVLLLGVILMSLVWQVRIDRPHDTFSLWGTIVLLGLYAVQAAIGALYIFSDFGDLFSILHVTFAGAMWAAAVALNVALAKQPTGSSHESSY